MVRAHVLSAGQDRRHPHPRAAGLRQRQTAHGGWEIRTVEVDPERALHVRWALAAYATGAYTLDMLQATLTDRG